MKSAVSARLPAAAAVAAVAVGLAFRLSVSSQPTETLTARYLADDYFYYLAIADNIAHGRGSSFDGGVTSTNGYQPLFLWLLVAVFAAGVSKAAAIQIGLVVQAIAAAAASLFAYTILAARGTAWAGTLAAGLLSLNLFFVLPTLTGFEMALALAAIMLALWSWHRCHAPILIGVLCGLAVLARVDSLLLPAAFGVILLFQKRLRDLSLIVVGALAISGPWFLWNWTTFGHPLPDSGVIKAHYRGLAAVSQAAWTAFLTLPRTILPARLVDELTGHASWLLGLTSVAILVLAVRAGVRRENRALALFAAGATLTYVCLVNPDEGGAVVRYLFPVWAATAMLLGRGAGPVLVMLALAIHTWDVAAYVRWEKTAPLPSSYVGMSHTLAPAAIDRLVPAGQRLASFDSGALGYFSPRVVVNLDGLVNHDIVELRQACREPYPVCLKSYLRSKDIGVLAGGTGFGWIGHFPDWSQWERLFESPPLVDGSRLVILRVPGTALPEIVP